ncbi:MAG: SUF system Fe-S cluster assembly protein [Gammaproteobacteria bacterium]|nr:SUF system Fe-S cluster assembly protein [Gammaproteobacteria bacterium]
MKGLFAKLGKETQTMKGPEDFEALKTKVVDALRTVYDPEIPLNLYDLGLIYDIDIQGHNDVTITMTLTTPHCPVAETMPGKVQQAVAGVDEVNDVDVKLVWQPPWDQTRMSDEAKLTLGLL